MYDNFEDDLCIRKLRKIDNWEDEECGDFIPSTINQSHIVISYGL